MNSARVPTLILWALLSACGSAGDAPDAGPIVGRAADYWVADVGNLWLYDGPRDAGIPSHRNRITVDAGPAPDGTVTFTPTSTTTGYAVQRHDADGIHSFLYDVSSDPDPGPVDYVVLPEQIRLGTYRAHHSTRTIRGTTFTDDIDITVLGFEDLVLPAGTFAHALHTRQVWTSMLDSSGYETTTDLWYAAGIGVIKRTAFTRVVPTGSVFNAWSEELAGVRTAQVTAGIVGELILLDDLAPADSSVQTGTPGIASDGEGYLVAARRVDVAASQTEIVATYVDAVGRPVWSRAVISDLGWSASTDYYDHVAVAFDGVAFWVVARSTAQDPARLLRQRVMPDGSLIDPPGGSVIGEGADPRLASDGASVLLVHARNAGSPTFRWDLYATPYDSDGPIGAEQQLGPPGAAFAGIAAGPGAYAVTFEAADATPEGSASDVYMLRVDSGGTVLDTAPIVVSAAPNNQGGSAVAPWAGGFVALWADSRDHGPSPPLTDIFGARIGGDGALLDGPAASGGVALQRAESQRYGVAAATGPLGTLLAWASVGIDSGGGVFARHFAPGVPFEVAEPSDPGVALSVLEPQRYAPRRAPAAAANARSHMVTWIHNIELAGEYKSIRGALVFPRHEEGTP